MLVLLEIWIQLMQMNTTKAFKWFSKGTQLNDADCMVGLANLYSSGDGVEQDTHKALELRKKAAALGNKQAMRDIAFMYEYGLGVEKI